MKTHFDQSQLYKAGDHTDTWMKEISQNILTPAYILRRLSSSKNPELRMAVADHLNTPEEVLLLLAIDDNADVRFAVAENHNMSRNVLNVLSNDMNPYVASRASQTLDRLLFNEHNCITASAVAS